MDRDPWDSPQVVSTRLISYCVLYSLEMVDLICGRVSLQVDLHDEIGSI